jgi:hypothetical protein
LFKEKRAWLCAGAALLNELRIIVRRRRVMSAKASINKLNDAMDAMCQKDARLIQTFSYYGKPDYWISPAAAST